MAITPTPPWVHHAQDVIAGHVFLSVRGVKDIDGVLKSELTVLVGWGETEQKFPIPSTIIQLDVAPGSIDKTIKLTVLRGNTVFGSCLLPVRRCLQGGSGPIEIPLGSSDPPPPRGPPPVVGTLVYSAECHVLDREQASSPTFSIGRVQAPPSPTPKGHSDVPPSMPLASNAMSFDSFQFPSVLFPSADMPERERGQIPNPCESPRRPHDATQVAQLERRLGRAVQELQSRLGQVEAGMGRELAEVEQSLINVEAAVAQLRTSVEPCDRIVEDLERTNRLAQDNRRRLEHILSEMQRMQKETSEKLEGQSGLWGLLILPPLYVLQGMGLVFYVVSQTLGNLTSVRWFMERCAHAPRSEPVSGSSDLEDALARGHARTRSIDELKFIIGQYTGVPLSSRTAPSTARQSATDSNAQATTPRSILSNSSSMDFLPSNQSTPKGFSATPTPREPSRRHGPRGEPPAFSQEGSRNAKVPVSSTKHATQREEPVNQPEMSPSPGPKTGLAGPGGLSLFDRLHAGLTPMGRPSPPTVGFVLPSPSTEAVANNDELRSSDSDDETFNSAVAPDEDP